MSERNKDIQDIAIKNGVNMDIEIPEVLQRYIVRLPIHQVTANECNTPFICNVCEMVPQVGEKYKNLFCNNRHMFHNDCLMLWFKKAIDNELLSLCPRGCITEDNDLISRELQRAREFHNNSRERKRLNEHYKHVQKIAIMNGINLDIEVPAALESFIVELPNPVISCNFNICSICKKELRTGKKLKNLSCDTSHIFHEHCLLLWLKKVIAEEQVKLCPKGCIMEETDPFYEQLRQIRQEWKNICQRQDGYMASMFS